MDRLWRIRIQYREPSFELRLGRVGPPYERTYELAAPDAAAAEDRARRRFERAAEESRVRWVRRIVGLSVAEADVVAA